MTVKEEPGLSQGRCDMTHISYKPFAINSINVLIWMNAYYRGHSG